MFDLTELGRIQNAFKELMTGDLPSTSTEIDRIGIEGDERLDSVGRVQIYREAYWIRLEESLEEDFPWIYALVGRTSFEKMVSEYLSQYPSQYSSLATVSQHFPQWIATTAAAEAKPHMIDIARFEWLKILALNFSPPTLFDFGSLNLTSEAQIESLTLKLNSSIQCLATEFDLVSTEETHLEPAQLPNSKKANILIWQFKDEVQTIELNDLGARLFGSLKNNETIGQFLSSCQEENPVEIQRLFYDWSSRGLIVEARGLNHGTI